MQNRYIIQERNISGFTHYEIIDTENQCKVIYKNKDYTKVTKMLKELEKIKIDTTSYIFFKDKEPQNIGYYSFEVHYNNGKNAITHNYQSDYIECLCKIIEMYDNIVEIYVGV